MKVPAEKLGSFFLGREFDISTGKTLDIPLHYDARDLTTHAVCVGMTGSGKTGLCVGLLEEAALDNVPTIMIDPKGDITNLLLQFPDLATNDFKPWINPDDARRKDMTLEEYAEATAQKWKNGLAECGIDSERMRALSEAAEYTIYTPGSNAGVQLNILGSLAAPRLDFTADREAVLERINGTVNALLGLAGIDADRMKSREAILLSGIFEHFWKEGRNLDLGTLILSIQNPPMRQMGVFDIETFFPQQDRFELSLLFNNLLASPGFQGWLEGDPLDIESLLYNGKGKPRQSIFYLAHLSESERMFFVTLLLENILTWTRSQPGTTSLRALLYFDEVFGFLPPVAEPPSKRPLMTMLKQARAFGVGCVLVTQNPVDIDYKGLTNAGTWFIGKLQAERDKTRVLEGLKNAISEAGGSSSAIDYDEIVTRLGSRVFLMHNVHEKNPVVFHTRWAMSYLRGPLTKPQVKVLMEARTKRAASLETDKTPAISDQLKKETSRPAVTDPLKEGYLQSPPSLEPSISQVFLPLLLNRDEALRSIEGSNTISTAVSLVYRPALLGLADVHFVDKRRGITDKSEKNYLLFLSDAATTPDWDDAEELDIGITSLEREPVSDSHSPLFAPVSATVNSKNKIRSLSRAFEDWLYYNARSSVAVHDDLNLFQHPAEAEKEFMIRISHTAREERDRKIGTLEKKFEIRIDRLEKKLRKEQRELAEDEMEHENRKRQELASIGETVLGFFMGRRSTSRIGTALNKRRMTAKAKADIEESLEEIDDLEKDIRELEEELEAEAETITSHWENAADSIRYQELSPRRTDISLHSVSIAWLPFWECTTENGAVQKKTVVEAFRK